MTKKATTKKSAHGSGSSSKAAKPARRRKIDPTTCERDYSAEEREFMTALDDYKRSQGRMFPTCSEILEVVRGLGYLQQDDSCEVKQVNDIPEADVVCTSL